MVDVTLEGLTKEFDTPSGTEIAVNNVDLEIDHGDFFTFVGPSGCGKTTTLRMIAGLETPTSGKILYDGEDVTGLPPQQRDIAMVFQNVALYPHMTNYDNIGYGLKVRDEMEDYDEKIREVAELLEITSILDKKPGQLSGGQKQRVGLGRSIIRDPNVILLDEPMSDLDAKLKAALRVEIQRVHQSIDTTMIYVTHDQSEAMTMSSEIGVMNDGELAQVGTPEEIFNSPNSEFVAQFIGQPEMNVMDASLSNGQLAFEGGNVVSIGDNAADEIGALVSPGENELRIGFRPRQGVLTDDPDGGLFPLEVDVWEPIGTEYIVHLRDENGDKLQVVTSDITSVESGQKLWMKELVVCHVFDPVSGERVYQLDNLAEPSLQPSI